MELINVQRLNGRIYPLLVGVFLGTLQTGLFLQLMFTYSSGFSTYLMMTLCWLVGSALGVSYAARWGVRTGIFLLAAMAAYLTCVGLLHLRPFDTRLWPVYAILIVTAGVYPGVFFARLSQTNRVASIFLWENNGFIVGLVAGTVLYMLIGRLALWIIPLLAALLLFRVTEVQPVTDQTS
ncbi:MAG: hypothetical protein R3E39_19410 [Anaerolineae bacterium]